MLVGDYRELKNTHAASPQRLGGRVSVMAPGQGSQLADLVPCTRTVVAASYFFFYALTI